MILFGFAGCAMVYILNPIFYTIKGSIPNIGLTIMAIILGLIFITDLIISYNAISKLKHVKITNRDATMEIRRMVKKKANLNYFVRRLIKAFPGIEDSTLKRKKLKKKLKKKR